MFYNLSKLLLSFLSVLFAFNLNASHETYAGLKKGFLSSSKTVLPTPKSSHHEIVPHIVAPKHDSFFDNEDSLWSKCCNKDMRKLLYEKIYALCGNDLSFVHLEKKIKSIEHNFALLDQGSYEPYKSKDFFTNFLFLYDVFFTQLANVIGGLNDKPQIEPFMMQALGSRLIKGKFNYMDSLPKDEQLLYKNDFISSTSSKESGEFKYYKESALLFGIIEPFRYMRQTLASKEYIYIIFNQNIENNYNKIVTINNDMHYVKGVISYRDTIGGDIFLHNNGAIVYNNSVLEEDGFILIKGWVFEEDYSLFYYARHPFLQERFFFEVEKFSPDDMSPTIKAMLASVGGMTQLDDKKFIFIPHHENISFIEIDIILKILYEIKTYLPKEDIILQLPWIDETINNLSTVLAENINELDQALDEVLPDNYNYDYTEHYRYREQKKNKIVKDKSNKDKDIAKIMNDIEQKYCQYTAKKRSFNDRELRDLLGDMLSDFNEVGISYSSKVSTRGSHTAVKVVSLISGWNTNLSLAKRSSKIYQAGTVRTIIKDWVHKARLIAKPD